MSRLAVLVDLPAETGETNPTAVAHAIIEGGYLVAAAWQADDDDALVHGGGWPTGLRVGDPHPVQSDRRTERVTYLRQIGWLDQRGRIWIEIPSSRTFDGGSLTPLLVEVGT